MLLIDPVKSDDSERVIGLPEPCIDDHELIHVEVTKLAQRSTADKRGYLFDVCPLGHK